MKKYAWTLVELIISITILIMLSVLCVNLFKPNVQKSRLFMYAAVKNITKGNITVIEKKGSLSAESAIGNDDWYCLNFADAFSLSSSSNCAKDSGLYDANIQFPNKVILYGIASPWVAPYEGANFKYKNIMIDIDGNEGKNKLWADRFPMRIISGTGKAVEGYITPVNCGNDVVYDKTNKVLVSVDDNAKNSYCESSAKNYTLDDEVLTYDVYKAIDDSEYAKARMVAGKLSHMEADCSAYGGELGYYSVSECDSAKIKILPECATSANCSSCTSNTCPEGSSDSETCLEVSNTKNPDGKTCFSLISKPGGGMSFMMKAVMSDIEDFQ